MVFVFICSVFNILLLHSMDIKEEVKGGLQAAFRLSGIASTPSAARPIVPLRSDSEKEFAQRCVRAHRGAVYIKHHRKAGGTSLYEVARLQTCPHIPVFASERPFFNTTHSFSALPKSTVYLTALRHPIDRIISLYWFEGRWPRTCDKDCEDAKRKDNTTKVAELDEWVESVYHQTNKHKFSLNAHTGCGLWQSVENYYTRQLLGIDRGPRGEFLNRTLTRSDLHRAKEILASFDLVLIQERFSGRQRDANMIRMFRSITGGNESISRMPHTRRGREKARNFEPPSRKVRQRLRELNKLDIELFEYAKQLSQQTVDRWVEREGTEGNELDLSILDECEVPPKNLTMNEAKVLLSGNGCYGKLLYYYGGDETVGRPDCMLHSSIR